MSEPVISIGVTGIDQCVAALNALPPKLAEGGMVRAVKKAGAVILATAKTLCPVRFGFLRDALNSRAKKMRDGKTFICAIGVPRGLARIPIDVISRGPRRGQTLYAIPSHEAVFVEKGTSTREATPFLRPAIASEAVNAVDVFQIEMEKEIDKAVLAVAYPKK